jgi:pimeloyl-ACP methyl ester carboxylesterase
MANPRRKRYTALYARPAPRRIAVRADADYGLGAEPDWRTVAWPSHVHDAEILGRRARYVDIGSGDGPPIVLIHGIASCWQIWLETIPALAQHRRVIGIDLPGFGASEMPQEPLSITVFAKTVDALCEHLGIESAVVFGHSMGGFTGAEMAFRHPERVAGLALVGAAGLAIADIHPQPGLAILGALIAGTPRNPATRLRLRRRPAGRHASFAIVVRHPTRIATDLLAEQVYRFPRPGILPAFAAMAGYDYRDRVSEISCPTLIIHGREDALVPVRDADEYGRLITDSQVVILDDTGHSPMLERPRRFNDELLRFIGIPVAASSAIREPESEPEPEPEAPVQNGTAPERRVSSS